VTTNPLHVRTMLQTYGKQLMHTRRLNKLMRGMRLAQGEAISPLDREIKRQQMIERVAREILDNLLVTGAENPIVDEIRVELQLALGAEFIFEHPFMEQDLQIFRSTSSGPVRLESGEANRVLSKLWDITLAKIDRTML
jgi:hypothetical protein